MIKEVYDAYKKLIKNSNIFECFVKSTALATLDDYIDNISKEKIEIKDESLKIFNDLSKIINDYKIIIIDLDADISLDLGLLLNNNLDVKPILSFNHIYHPYGVVGNLKITELIIKRALELNDIEPKAYCFILDYNRYFSEERNINSMEFDNQYEITDEELPYDYILRKIECDQVLVISKEEIKDDLNYYIKYLIDNKIEVKTVLIE